MDEYISIFTESSEELGIQLKSYAPLLKTTEDFLEKICSAIEKLNKDSDGADIDISADITKFKNDSKVNIKPDPIVMPDIKKSIRDVKSFQSDLDSLLKKYSSARNKVSYGGNYLSAILIKPKVYEKDIDEEKYEKLSSNIRNVGRALDWVEKVLVDLFNLADQDMNILTIVDKVYGKHHIFESVPAGVVMEQDADIVQMLPEGSGTWLGNTRDKKTSNVPLYIGRNHDAANYGEEEPKKGEEEPAEKTLDDYRRASAPKEEEEPTNKTDEIPPYTGGNEEITPATSNEVKKAVDEQNKAVQNFYYYTYNNSMNKHIRDDHSTGKRIDSDDVHSHNMNLDKDNKKEDNGEEEFHSVGESAKPWELSNFSTSVGSSMMESGDSFVAFESVMVEEVGDADDMKPKSDHPVKDVLTDIDRKTAATQQKAKKAVQTAQNVGRAVVKPVARTKQWISNMIMGWRDANETNIKEKMADPHARNNLFAAVKKAIDIGALYKAGILLNPVFIFLAVTHHVNLKKNEQRLRNEMIGELKTEIQIIDEKIKDADRNGDNKAKYQLMRLKNEMQKKLLRVGGGKGWNKII